MARLVTPCVEPLVISVIVDQDRTAVCRGIGEYVAIGGATTPRFSDGKHVMPQTPQDLDRAPGEVLIGV